MKRYLSFFLLNLILISNCEVPSPEDIYSSGEKKGNIFVDSKPQGAHIYLDETDTKKTTPDTLKGIEPGTHLVSLKLEGYPTHYDTVQVVENKTASLFFEFKEISVNISYNIDDNNILTISYSFNHDCELLIFEFILSTGDSEMDESQSGYKKAGEVYTSKWHYHSTYDPWPEGQYKVVFYILYQGEEIRIEKTFNI